MTYFVRAPHPPSGRRTDAGQLPPWLPGVATSGAGDDSAMTVGDRPDETAGRGGRLERPGW